MRGVIRRELRKCAYLPWADWADCDGDGNALALISKIVGELSEILDGYEGLKIVIGDKPKA